ncbi:phosphoglucosamine mutase [Candidatus Micrarchaeota archaeon]|nr:phosphoglucosamine mutase [Candidatus Micrarchaeota archaeon]
MAKYFGTNGIRGTFEVLTPLLALRASQAIGDYFNGGNVLVGRDCRLTSPTLHKAVLSGLESVGCSVTDLGIVTTPTAEFMVEKLHPDGLIIITASHNPPEWNALKVIDAKGVALSKERGEGIEEAIDAGVPLSSWDKAGSTTDYETATQDHLAAILSEVDVEKIKKRRLKVVLDCANGVPALLGPKLFEALGCEVILLNSEMDGHFPGRPSEPREENIQEMLRLTLDSKADFGIAWDGDGDRIVMADSKGEFIIGDRVFALCALLKLKEAPGPVVTTVATSKAVADVAQKFGQRIDYTAVGAPYLSELASKGECAIAGEEVGGVIWPEVSLAKDGFLTAAKIAEAVCGKPLSEWLAEFPFYYNVKGKVPCEPSEIEAKMDSIPIPEDAQVVRVDGVRLNFEDSWVIFRPSGTEPLIRVFAESTNEEKAKELVEKYEKLLK